MNIIRLLIVTTFVFIYSTYGMHGFKRGYSMCPQTVELMEAVQGNDLEKARAAIKDHMPEALMLQYNLYKKASLLEIKSYLLSTIKADLKAKLLQKLEVSISDFLTAYAQLTNPDFELAQTSLDRAFLIMLAELKHEIIILPTVQHRVDLLALARQMPHIQPEMLSVIVARAIALRIQRQKLNPDRELARLQDDIRVLIEQEYKQLPLSKI